MTKSIFYTIWHDILKMCNNRFYLSYHQGLAKWKNLFLVTYRLPFITLAFSFALGVYCRIPPEFSASFKQLWVNPILTYMHPPTHRHRHTQHSQPIPSPSRRSVPSCACGLLSRCRCWADPQVASVFTTQHLAVERDNHLFLFQGENEYFLSCVLGAFNTSTHWILTTTWYVRVCVCA